MLLEETAEAPGFRLKPTESQPPVGTSQDEEFWNTYQGVREELSRNTHKETEPVCERGKELRDRFFLLGAQPERCEHFRGAQLWICKYSHGSNYDTPLLPKVILEQTSCG